MGAEGAEDRSGWDPAERLRAHRLRATPQRRAILEAFDGGDAEHLSAEEIHARASARVQGIGRGTVYATLADLSEVGILSAVGDQDPVRYETNVTGHDHFRCRLCLRLFDIRVKAPRTAALAEQGFAIESVAVVVGGICRECQAFTRGLEDGSAAIGRQRQLPDAALAALTCVRHETPVGTLLLAASADGIARIAFEEHADYGPLAERARSRRGGRPGRDRVAQLTESVDQYLAGAQHEPMADLVDWTLVGATARQSLEATRQIGWGELRSYHKVCGGALGPYDCGWVMGANPIPLFAPCHRLTCGHGRLEAYVGGLEVRDRLQDLERR